MTFRPWRRPCVSWSKIGGGDAIEVFIQELHNEYRGIDLAMSKEK